MPGRPNRTQVQRQRPRGAPIGLRLEITGHVRSPHINTHAQPSENTEPGFTFDPMLTRFGFSRSFVALDRLDLHLRHENIAMAILVLRHVQGDLYIGLPVERESGSKS